MNTQEKLAALHNRATRYEVVAIKQEPIGETRVLIGYTARHSRHGLLAACRQRGEVMIKALGLNDTSMLFPAKRAADGFDIDKWSIRFSGRTQRDAILEGELQYVGDLPSAKEQAAHV